MLVAATAQAHHGWSSYDNHQTVTLSGTIAEASYTYPHATIQLQTADQTWLAVLAPPARMSSRGLPGDSLRTGAAVTVEGYASRRNPNEIRAERITIDQRTVELR
jgi:hypothetical protein